MLFKCMKLLAYTFLFFVCLTFIEFHTHAQNQKSRGGPQDLESSSQRDMRVKECETPGRVKPEDGIKRLSQLCGRAVSMPKPAYPEEAKSKEVSGIVEVQVVTDESGRVVWAKAISGPDLLQSVSIKAACRTIYTPTEISVKPARTETSIRYHFTLR